LVVQLVSLNRPQPGMEEKNRSWSRRRILSTKCCSRYLLETLSLHYDLIDVGTPLHAPTKPSIISASPQRDRAWRKTRKWRRRNIAFHKTQDGSIFNIQPTIISIRTRRIRCQSSVISSLLLMVCEATKVTAIVGGSVLCDFR